MQRISKSKLKASMLKIFRDIEASGEELIVTDHDVPVLRITPFSANDDVDHVFGEFRGGAIFHEDPDMPTTTEWVEV